MKVIGKLGSESIVAIGDGELLVCSKVLEAVQGIVEMAGPTLATGIEMTLPAQGPSPERPRARARKATRPTAKPAGKPGKAPFKYSKSAPRNRKSRDKSCATCGVAFVDTSKTNTRKWCEACSKLPHGRKGKPAAPRVKPPVGSAPSGAPQGSSKESRLELIRRLNAKVQGRGTGG